MCILQGRYNGTYKQSQVPGNQLLIPDLLAVTEKIVCALPGVDQGITIVFVILIVA